MSLKVWNFVCFTKAKNHDILRKQLILGEKTRDFYFIFGKCETILFHKSWNGSHKVSHLSGIYRRLASVKQICFTTDKNLEFLCPPYFSMLSNEFIQQPTQTVLWNVLICLYKRKMSDKWTKTKFLTKRTQINETIFNIILQWPPCLQGKRIKHNNKEEERKNMQSQEANRKMRRSTLITKNEQNIQVNPSLHGNSHNNHKAKMLNHFSVKYFKCLFKMEVL